VPGLVQRLDAFERRHPTVGFPLAVVYKFFDDQGPYLGAILTYYAFVAIFPILLIASSVLGFVLQGDPQLQRELLDSALARFPVVGNQLKLPAALQGSTTAVIVGSLTALYGVLGLGQAAQNALNTAWAVPRNSRFNPIIGRIRGFFGLSLAGLAVLGIAALSAFAGNAGSFGLDNRWLQALITLVTIALTSAVLAFMMRITTARRPSFRGSLPGALLIALLWHALQVLGGQYVQHVVRRATEVNAIFAVVLGLIALLYIAAGMAVLGLEVNVVLSRRLWPRALLTPFTDAVELTDADRRAYASYAKAQRHKGFERVEVYFDGQPVLDPDEEPGQAVPEPSAPLSTASADGTAPVTPAPAPPGGAGREAGR
jgi:membrane protein